MPLGYFADICTAASEPSFEIFARPDKPEKFTRLNLSAFGEVAEPVSVFLEAHRRQLFTLCYFIAAPRVLSAGTAFAVTALQLISTVKSSFLLIRCHAYGL